MKRLNATEVHAVEMIRRYISEGTAYENKGTAEKYDYDTVFYSYAENALIYVYGGAHLEYEDEEEIQDKGINAFNALPPLQSPYTLDVEQKGILLIDDKAYSYIVAVAD